MRTRTIKPPVARLEVAWRIPFDQIGMEASFFIPTFASKHTLRRFLKHQQWLAEGRSDLHFHIVRVIEDGYFGYRVYCERKKAS